MSFDHTVHDVFQARVNYNKLPLDADVRCCKCGTRLKTYYAEGQLYLESVHTNIDKTANP